MLSDDVMENIQPRVLYVGYHAAEPGWLSPAKNVLMKTYDLWYVADGAGAIQIDGQWHHFQAGDLITIKPGQCYEKERADKDNPFRVYFTHMIPWKKPLPTELKIFVSNWPERISASYFPNLGELFEQLFETFTTRPDGHVLLTRSLTLQIIRILTIIITRGSGQPLPHIYPRLEMARQFIREHYARPITLSDIAAYSDMSESYLVASFKRYYGIPPVRYVLYERIRQAKLLLAQHVSIKDASHRVGFNSVPYFSRTFRSIEHMTASEYVSQCRLQRGGPL